MLRTFMTTVVGVSVMTAMGCGSEQLHDTVRGCVMAENTLDVVSLVVNQPTPLAQPCSSAPRARMSTPVTLTASEDGLRVQFDVLDASFHPGTYRQLAGARDVVAVFPSGEGPGHPLVELALNPIRGGYRVDDTLPWETWGVHGFAGEFRLVVAMFDRDQAGSEVETRVVLHVRVQVPT